MYLLAKDPEDLAVISACLQDALVIFSDMSNIPKEHRFAAVCSRFRWEQLDQHERVRCGIHFDGILSTQVRGIDQKDQQRVLELLTIRSMRTGLHNWYLELIFSGVRSVRLEAEVIECQLRDLSEPWKTRKRPFHGLDSDL